MSEITLTGKHHGDSMFISSIDDLFIPYASTGLDDSLDACFGGKINRISERKERIASKDWMLDIFVQINKTLLEMRDLMVKMEKHLNDLTVPPNMRDWAKALREEEEEWEIH